MWPTIIVGQDNLPGYESEAWAKKSIEKLVLVRRHLCMIMTSCSRSFYPCKWEIRMSLYVCMYVGEEKLVYACMYSMNEWMNEWIKVKRLLFFNPNRNCICVAAMDDNEGGLAIGNKIYHIDTFLQNQIATFFELHLSTLLNNNNHDNHGIMARLGRTDYNELSSDINICMYVCMYCVGLLLLCKSWRHAVGPSNMPRHCYLVPT